MNDARSPRRLFKRLTSLDEAKARLAQLVRPVAARNLGRAESIGHVAAENLRASKPAPDALRAARNGFALASRALIGAAPQAPLPLAEAPIRVATGDALPSGADAVAPFALIAGDGVFFEAIGEVASGEGVLAIGADVAMGELLIAAGDILRAAHAPALLAAGFSELSVRAPRLAIWPVAHEDARGGDTSARLVAGLASRLGCADRIVDASPDELGDLLRRDGFDAAILIGGAGDGDNDAAYRVLAQAGDVVVEGVAIEPGERSGFGVVAGRPVLVLPGRPDAALAAALMLAEPLCRALSGSPPRPPDFALPLARKIASRPGFAELRFVDWADGVTTPLAPSPMPFAALGRARGYALVPADSEGIAAGEPTPIYLLP